MSHFDLKKMKMCCFSGCSGTCIENKKVVAKMKTLMYKLCILRHSGVKSLTEEHEHAKDVYTLPMFTHY